MQKGNQALLASATTSSLPTTSLDFCFTDNFTLFSFGRKQLWESEVKHFPAQLSCLCLFSLKDRSKSIAYRKHMQSINTCSGGYTDLNITCRELSLKAVLNTGPWSVGSVMLSWCARTGKRLTSCIKIHLKMKPALGNLFALSKPIVEKSCFLMKFFCKQRFSHRANSICCSLVRIKGWGWGEAGCAKWMGFIAFIYKKNKVKFI